jgi:two-component system response regulator
MSTGSILLVDDNPDDVALTLRALRKNNMTNNVDIVADGEEALRYLLGSDSAPAPTLPALILLDINLPKVTGLEVLRTIRAHERTRYLPVVMLTTSTEERDLLEGYDLGANSFVRKPVVFGEFVEAVRVLGLYWLLINQSALTRNVG